MEQQFPFIDLTRLSKQFILVRISLICDCYLYELNVNLKQLDKLVTNFVKSAKRKKPYLMPAWVKRELSTKFFIVNADEINQIEVHKIVLKHVEIDSQKLISKLVLDFVFE